MTQARLGGRDTGVESRTPFEMNRAAVSIPEKLFFKIGEVCDITGIQAHVLRYWESEFPMLAPQKNRAGQRTYRKRDVEMVLRIKELLYEDQYTIAGAKKRLTNELRGASKLKVVTPDMQPSPIQPAPQFVTAHDADDFSRTGRDREVRRGVRELPSDAHVPSPVKKRIVIRRMKSPADTRRL